MPTTTPDPLKGSVDIRQDRERARLLDDDEVEALEAQADEEQEDDA